MFMSERNLGLSDYAVKHAILNLQTHQDYISADDIADEIGCERKAVYRALGRLRDADIIKRLDGSPSRGGHRYVIEN